MKKLIIMLAVLLLATPAMATDVTITLVAGPGPNDVTVGFTTSSVTELVRAIALDVIVDDANVVIDDVNCVNTDYNIYPGSISIDAGGVVDDWGTCAGEDTGSNTVPTEMGSLYEDGDPTPAQSGDLFIITLKNCTQDENGEVVVSLTEDQLRGGVVLEDPEVAATVTLPAPLTVTGIPVCDDGGCQCLGDVVGNAGPDPDGIVNTADLGYFMGVLGPLGPPYDYGPVTAGLECLDLAGNTGPEPDGILNTADLGKMMSVLGPLGPPYDLGGCIPAP